MHIAVIASSGEFLTPIEEAFGLDANRYTMVSDWPSLSKCLLSDRPDLVIVERSALARIELAAVAEMARPGRWPPLLIAGTELPSVAQALMATGRLVEAEPPVYEIGDLRIDTRRKRATVGGKWVALPPIQYRILVALARRAGDVLNARELLRIVWGFDASPVEARELVKVHIRQIRRRLGLDPAKHHYIRSVRGFGYLLAPPDVDDD